MGLHIGYKCKCQQNLMRHQDDCKVFFYPLMVSLSNHRWLVWASFDKLRMSRNR